MMLALGFGVLMGLFTAWLVLYALELKEIRDRRKCWLLEEER